MISENLRGFVRRLRGEGARGTHTMTLTSLRTRTMRRMRKILMTRMMRALLLVVESLRSWMQACGIARG